MRHHCFWLLSLLAGAAIAACHGPAVPSEAPTAADHHKPGSGHPDHGHARGLHHDFSDVEGFAKRFDDPGRDAWQRPVEVLDHLGLEPGDHVVDLGTGTGYFVPYLSRAVGPSGLVLALDVEPNMVDHVKKRAAAGGFDNVQARSVAPSDPGLAPASVSRVLIVDTWHHLDDREAYARKLAQALQPGGEVWVVDFTPESDLGPPPEHRLPASQVQAELEAAGLLASVVADETLPKQYLVRGVRAR